MGISLLAYNKTLFLVSLSFKSCACSRIFFAKQLVPKMHRHKTKRWNLVPVLWKGIRLFFAIFTRFVLFCTVFLWQSPRKNLLKSSKTLAKLNVSNDVIHYAFCAIHCWIATTPLEKELVKDIFYLRFFRQSMAVLLASSNSQFKMLAFGQF